MIMTLRRRLYIVLILSSLALPLVAQHSTESFGKNRIQYRQFDWQYLSGENFDVYYYDARKGIAQDALTFLEGEFDRITDMIDYPPYFKTKVFIYNSLTDLRQSNMGLNRNNFKLGGETEFVKPFVEVAHLGTAQEFKEELLFRISDLMVNEMMFGGNLREMFQSNMLMNLPEWFVGGASLYVAKGWNSEMDDFIRQIVRTKKVKHATKLTGKQAALVGQSIWNFITEKYGRSSMANILNYTRVTRNEEKSIQITLGIGFKQMMMEWQRYYGDMETIISKSYEAQLEENLFKTPDNRSTEFTTVKLSPDGNYLAYAENDRGSYVVKVRSLTTGKEKVIIKGGTKVINQRVDNRQPILAWADAKTLGVIGVKNGQYVLWLYDLSTRSKEPRTLERFSNIRSFSFSGNGRLIIMSADFEGRSDLFLLSPKRDRVRRLTNDIYDDLDPSFIPSTNSIVFSSNRTNDTLRANTKTEFEKLGNNYNLFIFNLDTTNLTLKRVTNTLSKDVAPLAYDENNIYYLSDQRGISNLFRYNRSTGIYSQVTNYTNGIQHYDIDFSNRTMASISVDQLRSAIHFNKDVNLDRQVFTPATRRKELQQARGIREKRKQEESKTMSIKDLLNARKAAQTDTSTAEVIQDSVTQTSPTDTTKVTPATETQKKEEVVNTDNYVFEDDALKQNQPSESFLSRYMKSRERSRITGPYPYAPKFSYDNLITNMVIDPLRGFGLQVETQMNDMLENYRIYGGLMTPLDLRGGDFYAEFQYLPSLIDFGFRFDRKAVRWETEETQTVYDQDFKYTLNRLELSASLPLTDRMRISVKPFAAATRSTFLGNASVVTEPPSIEPQTEYYGGFRTEFTYDNSIPTGLNLIEGTRGKLVFQHHAGINNKNASFSQVYADIRHYQPIFKEIVFALRGYAGTFFGNSPKLYLLGGMDNWIGFDARTSGVTSKGEPNPYMTMDRNSDGYADFNPDILFMEYATSLRGFDYGVLFGNSVLMMSAELRIPIVRALTNGPISSNFFRNMQFTGFYDIGISWSGKPPFSSDNSVSYDYISEGPFDAEVKNYLNPWLYSYGVGMRTVILGFFTKFDLAWPVEDYQVGNPQLHVTLGLDF